MKPKDLKWPFTWEERRPELFEQVLFVPKHYDKHREWKLPSWEAIFNQTGPVALEYCSGNGAWIVEKALSHPDICWIGVEQKFERIRKIWAKMKNRNIQNLLLVCGEALLFTRDYLPDASIDQIYINFPDPWPKGKHAKHRLFQDPFALQMSRVAKKGAPAVFVTDHPMYAEQILRVIGPSTGWQSTLPPPHYITQWPGYGTSYFEQLWRQQGKTIHYIKYANDHRS